MKRLTKYPLLIKLFLIQLGTIGAGLLILLGVYHFTERAQIDASLSRLKAQITPTIVARQEQWRAWKYLGLDTAIQEEIDQILKQFPLKSIKVIAKRELPNPLPTFDLEFPQGNLAADDYVVLVELNSDQLEESIHAKSTVLITLGGIAVLFLGIILFSGRYIYRRVYLPILTLNKILSSRNQSDKTDFSSVPAIGEMRDFFNTLSSTLVKSIEENERLAREAAFGGVAKSVAHDIRSPLSALNMLLSVADTLPTEQKDMMRVAISRINRIADGLLQRSKKSELKSIVHVELIANLVTSSLSEKKLEMSSKPNLIFDLHITPSALDASTRIDAIQFSRVFSNLLNNSVEAGATSISTTLDLADGKIVLTIEDNGKGIPAQVLSRLRTENISYEKADGHGLGLQSLKELAIANNFLFDIRSEPKHGTTIQLRLNALAKGDSV